MIGQAVPVTTYFRRKRTPAFVVFFLLALPLTAQDTLVGALGTLVATEETPAAATNADALRKAAQNPVASLISVPVQDNFNFNISPGDRVAGSRGIVEKKKEEYKDYADQMKALAQQYIPPEKNLLQQAYQQGNIMMGPVAGNPQVIQLVIKTT